MSRTASTQVYRVRVYRGDVIAQIKTILTVFNTTVLEYCSKINNGEIRGLQLHESAKRLLDKPYSFLRRTLGGNALTGNWYIDDERLSDIYCKSVILAHLYHLDIDRLPDISGLSGENSPFLIVDTKVEYQDDAEAFANMLPAEQLKYLKAKVGQGNHIADEVVQGDRDEKDLKIRGDIAAELRTLRPVMKIEGLLALDETFVNIGLQDFLNLQEDGTKAFAHMLPIEQLKYLKTKVGQGNHVADEVAQGDRDEKDLKKRGDIAAELRTLRPVMKVDRLLALNETFVNIGLRDFLNLKEDGTADYTWDDVKDPESGWRELTSLGAKMHQTTASPETVTIADEYSASVSFYSKLNAKFIHPDGMEAVFKYAGKGSDKKARGELIKKYPDKGTFNYYPGDNDADLAINSVGDGKHKLWDMNPFEHLNLATTYRCNIGIIGNSFYWGFNE